MSKLALCLFLLLEILFVNNALAQSDNLFLQDVMKDKKNRIDSILNLNTEKQKLHYLALLPSLNYDLNTNRFNVGISLSNLAGYYQTKHRNKIELERLKLQLDQKVDTDLQHIEKEYELIRDTYEILKMELDNTTLSTEIFNLKKAQYDNNKITLEDWLNIQKNHQDRNLLLFAKRKNIISKMKQFEAKIKKNCFTEELTYFSQMK